MYTEFYRSDKSQFFVQLIKTDVCEFDNSSTLHYLIAIDSQLTITLKLDATVVRRTIQFYIIRYSEVIYTFASVLLFIQSLNFKLFASQSAIFSNIPLLTLCIADSVRQLFSQSGEKKKLWCEGV